MSHQVQDFVIHSGEKRTLTVNVVDENGAVVSIVGATEIVWEVLRTPAASTALISKSLTGTGITITDGPNGQFTIDLLTADSSSLFGFYWHRSTITLSSGDVVRGMVGTLEIAR